MLAIILMTFEALDDHKNVVGDLPSFSMPSMVIATARCKTAALNEWGGKMGLDKQSAIRIKC